MREYPWIILTFVLAQIKASSQLECFSCSYLPSNSESQTACSDPWRWYRDAFPNLNAPPKQTCQFSCMKILIYDRLGTTVVRDCGKPCDSIGNETMSATTTTTCCQDDLCNGSYQTSGYMTLLLGGFLLSLYYMLG